MVKRELRSSSTGSSLSAGAALGASDEEERRGSAERSRSRERPRTTERRASETASERGVRSKRLAPDGKALSLDSAKRSPSSSRRSGEHSTRRSGGSKRSAEHSSVRRSGEHSLKVRSDSRVRTRSLDGRRRGGEDAASGDGFAKPRIRRRDKRSSSRTEGEKLDTRAAAANDGEAGSVTEINSVVDSDHGSVTSAAVVGGRAPAASTSERKTGSDSDSDEYGALPVADGNGDGGGAVATTGPGVQGDYGGLPEADAVSGNIPVEIYSTTIGVGGGPKAGLSASSVLPTTKSRLSGSSHDSPAHTRRPATRDGGTREYGGLPELDDVAVASNNSAGDLLPDAHLIGDGYGALPDPSSQGITPMTISRENSVSKLLGSPAHPEFRALGRTESYGGLPVARDASEDPHERKCSGVTLSDLDRIFSDKLPTWDMIEESFRFHGVAEPVAASCLLMGLVQSPPEPNTPVSYDSWHRVKLWLDAFNDRGAAFDWLLAIASRREFFGFQTPTEAAYELRGKKGSASNRGKWLLRMSSQAGVLTLSCVELSTDMQSTVEHKRLIVTQSQGQASSFSIAAADDDSIPVFSGINALAELLEYGASNSIYGRSKNILLGVAAMRPKELFENMYRATKQQPLVASGSFGTEAVLSFSVAELSEHLRAIGLSDVTIERLADAHFDGSLVPEFCPAVLDEVGIKTFGDRMKLLKLAKECRPQSTQSLF